MFLPDNIIYFLSLFTVSIFFGTYLLFSYHRNFLLLLNSFGFLLCAIRATTEYYLPQVSSFEEATRIAAFHSMILYSVSCILWTCTWFYLRPFQHFQKEKLYNILVSIFLFIIPCTMTYYGLATRQLYYFNEEMIDGYWRFTSNPDNLIAKFSFIHSFYVMTSVMTIIFIHNIYIDNNDRLKKGLLCFSFIIIPFLIARYLNVFQEGKWIIPNSTFSYLSHLIIVSWFVSGYRMFDKELDEITKDVLNSVSDLAITTDPSLAIINMNEQAKATFLYQKTLTLPQLFTNNSMLTLHKTKEFIDKLLAGSNALHELQMESQHHEQKTFQVKVATLKKGSLIRGYTFLFSDLTNIKKKEIQLFELNRSKDQIFSIIGHDLRKPALSFRGISKKVNYLLQKEDFSGLKKLCASLEQSSFFLNNLLDNLLSWALSQRNALHRHPVVFDISEIIQEIIDSFKDIADNKSIQFQAELTPTTIQLDLNSFMGICRNLIDNSLKFTPVGGTITVSYQVVDTDLLIQISDTGVGMTEEQKNKLFEITALKNTKGTLGESGSGIGLNLVQELVKLNKGTIKVDSKIGEGSSFQMVFSNAIVPVAVV